MTDKNDKFSDRDLLISIWNKVENLEKNGVKIILALIGVIAATLGIKFIGSPAWVILLSYASFFGAAVLIASAWVYRKRLMLTSILSRVLFGIYLVYAVVVNDIVANKPIWLEPSQYFLGIILCILLVYSALTYKEF
jgi:hypothetical protein